MNASTPRAGASAGHEPCRRAQLFAEPRLQAPLVYHCWGWAAAGVVLAVAVQTAISIYRNGPTGALTTALATLAISLALLSPLVVWRAVAFSNRFIGPLVRIRGPLRRLADGEQVAPVQCRETDPWAEWIAELNRALARRHGSQSLQDTAEASLPSFEVAAAIGDAEQA